MRERPGGAGRGGDAESALRRASRGGQGRWAPAQEAGRSTAFPGEPRCRTRGPLLQGRGHHPPGRGMGKKVVFILY